MWEFRTFWDKWRFAYDLVEYESSNRDIDLIVVYLGPFCVAYHREPEDC